jgi:uncharacterized protein (DUF305 family)
MNLARTIFLLAVPFALGLGACGGAANPPAPPSPEAANGETSDPDRSTEASTEALEALYRARTDSARMRFTEADVRFMTGMIGHHAQAIVMSRLAPDRAASPSIQTLAARIINAQRDEIALMQQWLLDRDQPVPEVEYGHIEVVVHGSEHAHHAMDAPGMLTPEQLRELDRERGPEFDRLFLTYMIAHHNGAVSMVHDLFARDGAAQDEDVFRLASDIQVDQITEVARMRQMLAAMSSEGGVP